MRSMEGVFITMTQATYRQDNILYIFLVGQTEVLVP